MAIRTLIEDHAHIMKPKFFANPLAFRSWLEKHHASAAELLVGFHKKGAGTPSITWPESVDQALCFGWIDGVRKRLDDTSYTIRFTPRRASSIWSAVNIGRVAELKKLGAMQAAGLAAFDRRSEAKSRVYAYERTQRAVLAPEHEKQMRANQKAWAFFQSQAPSYQRTALHWVASAKQEATRIKRLAQLIELSASGKRA